MTAWGDKEGKKPFNEEQGKSFQHGAENIGNQTTVTVIILDYFWESHAVIAQS